MVCERERSAAATPRDKDYQKLFAKAFPAVEKITYDNLAKHRRF